MALNPDNVPAALVSLLPMAERWGIGDDFEREQAVSDASTRELEDLVHCADDVSEDDLFGWLEGDESFSRNPSAEYVAFTCLTMAMDSARLKLSKR